MSIRVELHHVTHYRYDRLVSLSPQVVRLRPAPHCRTPILSYSMRVEPAEHFINWQQDAFANYQARLVFPEKTREFKVTVDLVAEMAVYNPFDFFLEPSAEQFPFDYAPGLALELAPYLIKRPMTPRFAEFVASIDRTPTVTADFLGANAANVNLTIGIATQGPETSTLIGIENVKTGSGNDVIVEDSAQLGNIESQGGDDRVTGGHAIENVANRGRRPAPGGAIAADDPGGTDRRFERAVLLVRRIEGIAADRQIGDLAGSAAR